jgi:hypothetical protein
MQITACTSFSTATSTEGMRSGFSKRILSGIFGVGRGWRREQSDPLGDRDSVTQAVNS